LKTGILGGVELGFHAILILSGDTRPEDLARYAHRPEVVVDTLADFSRLLEKTNWRPLGKSANGAADTPASSRLEVLPGTHLEH
jgi:NagD protein